MITNTTDSYLPITLTTTQVARMLPYIARLHYMPFKKVRELVRAQDHAPSTKGMSRAEAVMFLAFTVVGNEKNEVEHLATKLAAAEGELRETKLQLDAANAGARSARTDASVKEKLYEHERRERVDFEEKNQQLIGAMRQLMHL